MKKEELRIGNYVTSKLSGRLKVQMIPIDIDMNNYEPIPLTEEWLKKFSQYSTYGDQKWFSLTKLKAEIHLSDALQQC